MTEEKKEANPFDASYGDWEKDFAKKEGETTGKKQYNDKKIEWMKFDKPGKYKVRLVGKYVKYLKHYKPFGKGVRIISHPDYKKQDPAWLAGFYPGDTFAIHIIDRADGKLKILDKGKKLFECFFDYGTANNVDPAGKDAPNFDIKVEWPNGNKNRAKYSAVPAGPACPLTEEEKVMVKANHVNLGQIYRATALDKIKEAWEAVPEQYRKPIREDDDGNPVTTPAKATATATKVPAPVIEESMTKAPAEEDDLFGDNAKKDESTDW